MAVYSPNLGIGSNGFWHFHPIVDASELSCRNTPASPHINKVPHVALEIRSNLNQSDRNRMPHKHRPGSAHPHFEIKLVDRRTQ